MKSKMKKLVSLVLAMAMVFTMSAVVFAADDAYTITISNSTDGYEYEAYQIFAGDYSSTDESLTNIVWGNGVDTTTDDLLDAIKAISYNETTPFSSCSTAEDVASVLSSNNTTALAEKFADVVSAYLVTDKAIDISYVDASSNYQATNVSAGYYLVKNTAVPSGEAVAYSDYILEVVKDIEVDPKSSVPEVEKKVKETNDTTGKVTDWQDAADYDIGDTIPYQLTGTMPETLSSYDSYYYQFVDTLSKGLTLLNGDAEVTVSSTEDTTIDSSIVTVTVVTASEETVVNTNDYTVTLANYDGTGTYAGGTVLKVTFNDVLSLTDNTATHADISVTYASKIVVTYNAKLNDNANIGSVGNPNEVYLVFSNNPNNTGSGGDKGQTPEDKVTVFTFTLIVNKVDEDNAELKGAGFTLYKYNESSSAADKYDAVGDEVKDTDMTVFNFEGLDSGLYKIVETTTPIGYNTADPVYFQIVAEYSDEADDPTLTSLVVKDVTGVTVISKGEDAAFAVATDSTSKISTDVVNKKGSVLPSTGGIGTTIFYIVGAVLVLGAGVILVTRRRTRA